ncbi:caspase domain-containing protein [Lactarius indigo]|nr:caspase domain-containing protein [Lactarius indigo]
MSSERPNGALSSLVLPTVPPRIRTYGYTPDDITVLKDDTGFPDRLQPTRANMTLELIRLVHDAAPGDKFTFFYSGHSDQRLATEDYEEEDRQDEDSLPNGCSLLAVLDTCHSGTMLDLPHSHCNNVYVPWVSKGTRRTLTIQNKNVRSHAMGFPHFPDPGSLPNAGTMTRNGGDQRLTTHLPPLSSTPLRIDTRLSGSADGDRTIQCAMSVGEPEAFLTSPMLCDSPMRLFACDGWCQYDAGTIPHPKVLSLSSCSDSQLAWEGPNGSFTTVLCKYLKTRPRPSYRDLMSHVNFALHENSLELHKYTRYQKKEAAFGRGDGFDGELDDFQEPQLSSLAKLNMDDILDL